MVQGLRRPIHVKPGLEAWIPLLSMLLLLAAPPAHASDAPVDWKAVAEVREIHALTLNEDGSSRETKIWLAVVDGRGYIRTSRSTRWGKNVVRDPDITVRIEGMEHPVHVTFIEDDALRDQVIGAFRAKYGATDWWLKIFRGRSPHIMRLDPRSDG